MPTNRRSAPGAAVLAVLLSLVLPAVAGAEDDPEAMRAAAVKLGREGSEAYKGGRFPEALEKFEAAYRSVPAPQLVLNLSRTELKLGHCDKALTYALTYSAAFGESVTASQESPAAWIASVKADCPEVEITTDPPGAGLTVDGRTSLSVPAPWKGRLAVGAYRILARRAGSADQRARLDVRPSTAATLQLSFAAPAEPVRPSPPVAVAPVPPPAPVVVAAPRPAAVPLAALAPPAERSMGIPSWAPWLPTGVALAGAALAIAEGVETNQCAATTVLPVNESGAAACQANHAAMANIGWGIAGAGAIAAAAIWIVRALPAAPPPESGPIQLGFLGNGAQVTGRF